MTDFVSVAKQQLCRYGHKSMTNFICIINTYLKWYFDHFIKKKSNLLIDTQNSIKLSRNELLIHSLRRSCTQIKSKLYYTTKTIEN